MVPFTPIHKKLKKKKENRIMHMTPIMKTEKSPACIQLLAYLNSTSFIVTMMLFAPILCKTYL